jgi:hypothetical protein
MSKMNLFEKLIQGISLLDLIQNPVVTDAEILYTITKFPENKITDNLIINILKIRRGTLLLNFFINKLENKQRVLEILNTSLSLTQFEIIYDHIKEYLFLRLYLITEFIPYLEKLELFDDIIRYSNEMKDIPINAVYYNKDIFEKIINYDEHITDEYFKKILNLNLYYYYQKFLEVSSLRIVNNINLTFTSYKYIKNILKSTKNINIVITINDISLIPKIYKLNKENDNRIRVFRKNSFEELNEYFVNIMDKIEFIYEFHEFVMRCLIFPRGFVLYNWLLKDFNNRYDFLEMIGYNFNGILRYLSEIKNISNFMYIFECLSEKQKNELIGNYQYLLLDNGYIGYF